MCVGQRSYQNIKLLTVYRRVPCITALDCDDLHQHKGSSISFNPSLYHLQEFDYHSHCLRRGPLVWWLCHWHGSLFVRLDGSQLCHCRLGRRATRLAKFRPRQHRSICSDFDSECWVHVDALQLSCQCRICLGHEEENQIDEFQGFRQ